MTKPRVAANNSFFLFYFKGASEFWKVKMRTLHRILDVNKDGVVSFDDFKLLTERFTNLGHLSDEHREVFQKKIQVNSILFEAFIIIIKKGPKK